MPVWGVFIKVKIMEMLSPEEEVEFLSRYAVVMHLEANRRSGRIAMVVFIIAICISVYSSSFWPLFIALIVYISAHLYLIFSCLRFVENKTGMSRDAQAYYSRLYKTDEQFAKKVDEQNESALNIANHLKTR